ncbi:integral membrane protein GPR137 isoform X3 [Alexandromys fortis]|uniref:integral membrane protein GPR137 isoform X3 n=1 Tax=Alexandromys fortis TaxID=100897 RepID=UPI002152DE37|nr:integral membrane protein GPR137 isoform X3 [Microtus fortis]
MIVAMVIALPGPSDQDGEAGSFLLQLVEASRCPTREQPTAPSRELLPSRMAAWVVFKAKAKRRPEMSRGLLAVRGAFVGASLLFLLVNVLCAVLSRQHRAQPWVLLLVRVLVSDSLFVICALSLAACLCLVARRAPSTSIYLEAKGTSVCQAAAIGGAMVLLYASRACYNLAALALAPRSRLDAFDYDWYNVSDQADLVNDLGNKGYLVFGLILFVWELLPTTLLVGFFRVHRPPQDLLQLSPHTYRAPVESSTGRFLAPVPTSLTGLGTVRMRAAPGSTAGVRAPACPAAWALAAGMVPSGASQAGAGPARQGPLLCSSPRCQDLAATTTASIPHHRHDLLLLPLEHPGPSFPYPWPLCQVHLPLLAQDARGLWLLLSSGQLLAAPIVVSLCHPPKIGTRPPGCRMPTVPWHDLPPLLPHWSQLPLLCLPLNKQSLCPVPSSVICLSSVPSCLGLFSIRLIKPWSLTWVAKLSR